MASGLIRTYSLTGCHSNPHHIQTASAKKPVFLPLQHQLSIPSGLVSLGRGGPAFARAREDNKPIFLSVGYSTCYWCHVMERECFENEAIARLMNEHFVCIKVDREERPDQLYMTATQILTRQGGWPMSVWLTPDLKPFYAGTYFPPQDAYNRPETPSLLSALPRRGESAARRSNGTATRSSTPSAALRLRQTQLLGSTRIRSARSSKPALPNTSRGSVGLATHPPFPYLVRRFCCFCSTHSSCMPTISPFRLRSERP